MIHRYIYPQADGVEKGPKARQNAEKRHVWMKTNMLATSKLLRELAGRKKPGVNTDTTELTEEESVCQSSSPLKSKHILGIGLLFVQLSKVSMTDVWSEHCGSKHRQSKKCSGDAC